MDTWEQWWRQANYDLDVCDLLHSHEKWAACCFFAQQAIEKALKALSRRPTTWDILDTVTWNDLDEHTWDEIERGGRQRAVGHSLPKNTDDLFAWHRAAFEALLPDLKELETLSLSESTRNPDARRPKGPLELAPCDSFTEVEATRCRSLAHEIVSVVRSRI